MASINSTITAGVTLAATGSYSSPLTVTAQGYIDNIDANGDAIVGPDGQSWTVSNYGRIQSAGGNGISLADGGLVTNGSGAAIGGRANGVFIENQAGSVINAGTITGTQFEGVYLSAGGYVGNAATGVIRGVDEGVYAANQAVLVVNSGTIASSVFQAIYLGAGGTVSNNGGLIQGNRQGVLVVGQGGAVSNTGTIIGSTAPGVYLGAGGTVTNSGGLIAGANDGIYIWAGSGTVTNTGAILGLGSHAVGISLGAGGTVISSGTISGAGGTAIAFGGTGANRLVLGPGYKLDGVVAGSTLGGATNTLELASAASVGTVSGLGAAIINFGTLQFDSGARWTAETGAGGMPAIIIGFTVGDTIDLDGFVAIDKIYTGSALVLTDSVANHVTLGVQGVFSTSDFTLSSDHHGGTDVMIVAGDTSMPSEVLGGPYSGDENSVVPLDGISVSVSPNGNDPLSVTLSVASGILTAGGQSGASITLSGTAATLNTALGGLTYSGTKDFYGSDTLSMTTTDPVDQNKVTANTAIKITPNIVTVGNGANTIALGNGNDTVSLGTGSNTVTGGDGNDIVNVKGGAGNNSVTLGNGNDTVILGNGNNTVILGSGNDKVVVGNNNNTITVAGTAGSKDTISAGNGDNVLNLGAGAYDIVLGNGNNTVNMAGGIYSVTAGHGTDLFVFETPQALLDLKFAKNDVLVFSNSGFDLGVDNGKAIATPQPIAASLFSAKVDGTFSSAAGRFAYDASSGSLYYDKDGSNPGSTPVLVAELTNEPHLSAANLFFIS